MSSFKVPDTRSRYGGAIEDYYIRCFRKALLPRSRRIAALQSSQEALKYIASVREKLSRIFSPFPAKTALNAQITGQLETPELRIDKVVFESRPGLLVPGHFIRRLDSPGKIPGLLFIPGHSQDGKAYEQYQRCAQFFALNGYGVFSFDPLGQGERHEGISSTECHTLRGLQLLMAREKICTWMLWDAIRALDYLASRPEIDATRLGVTGTSGGGNMTMLLSAFDNRLSFAIPSCFRNSHLRVLENEQTGDLEQHMPGMVGQGLEMADFLIAAAPRRTLLLGQDEDFFDLRGLQEVYSDAAKIYDLLGEKGNLQLHVGHGSHGYWENHRLAAARFMGGNLSSENATKIFSETDLACFSENTNSEPVLQAVTHAAIRASSKPSRSSIRQILKTGRIAPPNFRLGSVMVLNLAPALFMIRYRIETEPGLFITLKHRKSNGFLPLRSRPDVWLFIPENDTLLEWEKTAAACPEDSDLFCLELRGTGETVPATIDFQPIERAEYRYAVAGYDLGKPYLGGRVRDILATVKLLKKHGAKTITLIGNGKSSLPVWLAGFLKNLPTKNSISLSEIITTSISNPPSLLALSGLFPEILHLTQDISPEKLCQ